ncbi:hypothetical protein MWU76_17945 [Gelidibacter sp. F2691]|nr:hypothetical protein [Gelidibacter sp. F2691]
MRGSVCSEVERDRLKCPAPRALHIKTPPHVAGMSEYPSATPRAAFGSAAGFRAANARSEKSKWLPWAQNGQSLLLNTVLNMLPSDPRDLFPIPPSLLPQNTPSFSPTRHWEVCDEEPSNFGGCRRVYAFGLCDPNGDGREHLGSEPARSGDIATRCGCHSGAGSGYQ